MFGVLDWGNCDPIGRRTRLMLAFIIAKTLLYFKARLETCKEGGKGWKKTY